MGQPPKKERRSQPRTTAGNEATHFVQPPIRPPSQALSVLEQDLATGADPEILVGLLDAAEAILAIRGVDRSTQLGVLRQRLERARR